MLRLHFKIAFKINDLVSRLLSEQFDSQLLVIECHLRHPSNISSRGSIPIALNSFLISSNATDQTFPRFKVDLSSIHYFLQQFHILRIYYFLFSVFPVLLEAGVVQDFMVDCNISSRS